MHMLRRADRNDLKSIQAVLNAPGNLAKLEGYSDELVLAAISDPSVAFLVWQEGTKFGGFCWLHKSPEDTKIKSLVSAFLGAALGRGSLPPYWSMRRSKAFPHGLA